jgi:hypothetical protein
MQEIKGNLFSPSTYLIQKSPTRGFIPCHIKPDAICVTTNGFVKSSGIAVCGRGCALEATKLYPDFAEKLGNLIFSKGNKVHIVIPSNPNIVSFPVKSSIENCAADKSNVVKHMQARFQPGNQVPGWACKARTELIIQSALQLVELTNQKNWKTVVLPMKGCGFG